MVHRLSSVRFIVRNIFCEALPPPDLAGGHAESKLPRRIREKKIAMGYKSDDHEEQLQIF